MSEDKPDASTLSEDEGHVHQWQAFHAIDEPDYLKCITCAATDYGSADPVVADRDAPDIVAFIAERLNEVETKARAAYAGGWYTQPGARGWTDLASFDSHPNGDWSDRFIAQMQVATNAEHIALHDPAYVLADIAAKRRILAEHAEREIASLERHDWGRAHRVCRSCMLPGERSVVHPCPTVRLLAAPFREHADFNSDWSLT